MEMISIVKSYLNFYAYENKIISFPKNTRTFCCRCDCNSFFFPKTKKNKTKNSYNSKVQTEQILPGYKYKYCYIKSLILFITIINRLRSFYAKRKGLFMF